MTERYDVIIAGSGAGGGTLAHTLVHQDRMARVGEHLLHRMA